MAFTNVVAVTNSVRISHLGLLAEDRLEAVEVAKSVYKIEDPLRQLRKVKAKRKSSQKVLGFAQYWLGKGNEDTNAAVGTSAHNEAPAVPANRQLHTDLATD